MQPTGWIVYFIRFAYIDVILNGFSIKCTVQINTLYLINKTDYKQYY